MINIRWGTYKQWEGPWCAGTQKLALPSDADDNLKVLAVITATEGGCFDAVNMYDRMILSCGLVQWGEAGQFSVSDMLGQVMRKDPDLLTVLRSVLPAGVDFKLTAAGRYRFFLGGVEVTTVEQQKRLFLLRSTGLIGSWDDESKAYAKQWASGLVNVFQQKGAQEAQAAYTTPRLRGFATKDAQQLLWGADTALPNEGWVGAMRAGFLSFAANLPATAGAQLSRANVSGLRKWSPEWCIALFKQLTFGPGIVIYPGRYEKIRPVLERIYGVDLPDFAKDLQAWHDDHGIDPGSAVPSFTRVEEIQAELLSEGYDLGPWGVDGKDGPHTRELIKAFQTAHGLTADGLVGAQTRKALADEFQKRQG